MKCANVRYVFYSTSQGTICKQRVKNMEKSYISIRKKKILENNNTHYIDSSIWKF